MVKSKVMILKRDARVAQKKARAYGSGELFQGRKVTAVEGRRAQRLWDAYCRQVEKEFHRVTGVKASIKGIAASLKG